MVGLCMGDLGVPSRILFRTCGLRSAYSAFNKERGIAPGLMSFEEMLKVYHYDRITPETQVFGVIGDPVARTGLGPLVHNTAPRGSASGPSTCRSACRTVTSRSFSKTSIGFPCRATV